MTNINNNNRYLITRFANVTLGGDYRYISTVPDVPQMPITLPGLMKMTTDELLIEAEKMYIQNMDIKSKKGLEYAQLNEAITKLYTLLILRRHIHRLTFLVQAPVKAPEKGVPQQKGVRHLIFAKDARLTHEKMIYHLYYLIKADRNLYNWGDIVTILMTIETTAEEHYSIGVSYKWLKKSVHTLDNWNDHYRKPLGLLMTNNGGYIVPDEIQNITLTLRRAGDLKAWRKSRTWKAPLGNV